jgi:hypothetical protein
MSVTGIMRPEEFRIVTRVHIISGATNWCGAPDGN